MDIDKAYAQACSILRELGASAYYKGFHQTAYAAALCAVQPDRLHFIVCEVYWEVADYFRTSRTAVEKNIRTARVMIWRDNRNGLESLAGGPLGSIPKSGPFLVVLVTELWRRGGIANEFFV